MPNSLNPLSLDRGDKVIEPVNLGRTPLRHRISKKFDAIGAQVPTRSKVPARSVTPIY